MSERPLVIYHGNCMDGFTAAWACWLKHPDWEYYAATHGEPPPEMLFDPNRERRDVYILDFSYKLPVMLAIADHAENVVVLDHHQSAEKELQTLITGRWEVGGTPGTVDPEGDTYPQGVGRTFPNNVKVRFDMEKSGARLAWEYFHPDAPVPKFVQIVEDRDLWRFELHGTREIAAAVFSYPYDFDVWNVLAERCEEHIGGLVTEGAAIERKHHKDIRELVGVCKRWETIGGHLVPVANLPYTLASDAGHMLLADGAPFAATWYETATHRVYSLRSAEDGMDVSEVARLYGGGGHKHAAGFRMLLSEVPR